MAARTDGIPLFVEELTKMMLESGWLQERADRYELAGPLPPVAIPTTLQDSLMARLDRLAPVKEVAQLAATLGREFPYELLRAVSPLDETTLQYALARLVAAELLYQRGTSPQATYLFKHALIQEAAYQSVLKSSRQWYHQQIAQVLAGQFPGIVETQPELLGHHYTEAGLLPQAIPYWQLAGRRATERSANLEAISQLTKGLELLKTLPHTPEHLQQELLLWTTLGPALMATKGFAAPEVERAYARARELCQQIGETPQLFPVLFGLWVYSLVRAELQEARRLGEQLLNLAQSVSDRALPLEAHNALGTTLFYVGELRAARDHCEQGLALYDPHQHRSHAFLYGLDPGVVCLSHLARILWLLGYPDQAVERTRQALGLAQELAHPFSLGFALYNAGIVDQLRGEGQLCQNRAEAVMGLSREQEFPFRLATATILRGWAVAKRGGTHEGIAQMRQGLAMLRGTGAELTPPYFLTLLAEVYRAAEQAEMGLSVLGEALAAASSHGERYYEAELYRLQGELLLRSPSLSLSSPEECFQQALDPLQRRQRTLDAIKRLLLRESQVQPLLLVCEDLHWIDTETQAVLDSLIESLPTARCLLLVDYRPEYQHGWGRKMYYTQLRLDPLSAMSAQEVRLLQERWGQVKDGVGQVVLLSGEAGIGKSTLVATLRAHVAREASLRIAFRCSLYHTNSALYPVIEHMRPSLGFPCWLLSSQVLTAASAVNRVTRRARRRIPCTFAFGAREAHCQSPAQRPCTMAATPLVWRCVRPGGR